MSRALSLLCLLVLVACGADEATPIPPTPAPAAEVQEEPDPVEDVRVEEAPVATHEESSPAAAAELDAEASPTPMPEVPPTELPPTTALPATTETISIEAADGLTIIGTLATPGGATPAPAVLLLHMLGSDRAAWAPFMSELTAAGYAALAIDLRGHGDTGGERDWVPAEDDVQRAWQVLASRPEVDVARTAILGSSIGSNLALRVGAAETAVAAVALLSPGLDYRGVTTEDALAVYGDRPLLIVASIEDGYSANSSQTLADLIPLATTSLEFFDGAGHGTAMFAGSEGALTPLLLEWLQDHLGAQ